MKRRIFAKIWILILLSSVIFTGCVREEINEGGKLDPDESKYLETKEPEAEQPRDTDALLSFDSDGDEITVAWRNLQAARELMAGLTAIEENQLLYTKIEDSEESINLRLKMTGIDSEETIIGAVGSVKTQGNVIPLEIYYKDGMMVRRSGGKSAKEESTKEKTLATVDFLQSIIRDLKQEDITSAEMIETMDGLKTISLVFEGTISGLPTSGRGEILIGEDGLIASEGYSFEAVNKDGKKVSQSVECTLLAVNDDVKAVDLPSELQ